MTKELSKNTLKRILRKHFPKNKILEISRISEGYSHYMYDCTLDNKNVILRISFNRKEEVNIHKEEWMIKQYKKTGAPVPKIYAVKSEKDFDYMLLEKFKGENLEKIWTNISRKEKIQVGEEIGKLLKKLHSITFKEFGEITDKGLKVEESFKFRQAGKAVKMSPWVAKLFKDCFVDFSKLIAQDLVTKEQSAQIVKYLHSHTPMIKKCKPVLAHMDFNLGHLFVQKINKKWKITGLIDFEFAKAYAPEFDFIKLHRSGVLEDKKVKQAIKKGYGNKLHKDFDDVVLAYRISRDIGFVAYVAKAGNIKVAKKALEFVLKTVRKDKHAK